MDIGLWKRPLFDLLTILKIHQQHFFKRTPAGVKPPMDTSEMNYFERLTILLAGQLNSGYS